MRQPAIPKLSELSTAGRADLAQPDRRAAGADCHSSYGAAIGAGAKRTDQAGSGQVRLASMAQFAVTRFRTAAAPPDARPMRR